MRAAPIALSSLFLSLALLPLVAPPAIAPSCGLAQLTTNPIECVPGAPCGTVAECLDACGRVNCPDAGEIVQDVRDRLDDAERGANTLPHGFEIRQNPDGSRTVTYETCDEWGWSCERHEAATVPERCSVASWCARAANASAEVSAAANRTPRDPAVSDNPDATWTVTAVHCDARGAPCERRDVATTPNAACFEHNPDALTNACVAAGETPSYVLVPTLVTNDRNVCVIGPVCVAVPVPSEGEPERRDVGWIEVHGYAELTVACGTGAPCRLTV